MAITFTVGNEQVTVNGAASESTLQSLVAAMNGNNVKQRRDAVQMGTDLKSAGQSAAGVKEALDETARSSRTVSSAVGNMASSMSDSIVAATGQYQVNTATVGEFAQNLLATSTQISREWSRAFVSLANGGLDPVSLSANTFKAGIDAASTVVGGMANILGPVAGSVAKSLTGLAAAVGKTGIDLLKEQLLGSIRAFERYNKMGAVFSEGLGEMRVNTSKTGLSFEAFSRVIETNKENVKAFGGTLTDGITKLANVSDAMSRSVDSSGKTVRQRLLNMGIGIEEQTEIAASYLAQERALQGSRRTKMRDDKEVAELTAKYAVDLKVLQEATGKDAKAIMEKSRQETMRASLMNKLSVEQRESLTGTFAGMKSLPDAVQGEVQQALTQVLAGGTITNKAVANSEELYAYVMKLADGVRSGSKDMQKITQAENEQLRSTMLRNAEQNRGLGAVADTIMSLSDNVDPLVAKQATMVNSLIAATNLEVGATEKSYKNAVTAANTSDVLQNNVSKITEQSARITSSLNTIATEALPKVVPSITDLVTGVANQTKKLESVVTGKSSMDQFLAELKTGLVSAWSSAAQSIKQTLDSYFGTRRPAGAPGETRDTGTLGKTGRLFEVDDFYGKVAKGETVLTPRQLENLVSGVSHATIGDAVSTPSKSMQDGFSTVIASMQASQQKMQAAYNAPDPSESLPTMVSEALTSVFAGPNGFASVMASVKTQLSDDTNKQMGAMQEQISKLNDLVSIMQDNVRASERIANELS
jgi:hypothetical protein